MILWKSSILLTVKACSGELGSVVVMGREEPRAESLSSILIYCAAEIFNWAVRITWDTVDPFLLSLSRLKRFLGSTCVSGIWILNAQKAKGEWACHEYCIWQKNHAIAGKNVLTAMESKPHSLVRAERAGLRVPPLNFLFSVCECAYFTRWK